MQAEPYASLPDSILTKPVDSATLFNQVNAAVVKHGGRYERVLDGSTVNSGQVRWLSGVKLLLVDDSTLNLDVAQRILERQGAEVWVCTNGLDALNWLSEPEHGVDAVLMDVQMPVMDGIEAVTAMRGELGLDRLPVIALTAGALSSERQRALDAGMDDFLTKPFEPDQMVRTLRRYIELARGAPLPVARHAVDEQVRPQWPVIQGLRMQEVERRLGGDWRTFQSTCQRCLREFGDFKSPMVIPGDQAARIVLADRLHKLAGNAGLIGAEGARALATDLELRLRRVGQSIPEDLLAGFAGSMQELDAVLAPHLEDASEAVVEPEAGALSDADLAPLIDALELRQFAALAAFDTLAPRLKWVLGTERFDILDQAIRSLQFMQAQCLLNEWRCSPPGVIAEP